MQDKYLDISKCCLALTNNERDIKQHSLSNNCFFAGGWFEPSGMIGQPGDRRLELLYDIHWICELSGCCWLKSLKKLQQGHCLVVEEQLKEA